MSDLWAQKLVARQFKSDRRKIFDLYYSPFTPESRAVLLLVNFLKIPVRLEHTQLTTQDTLWTQYSKTKTPDAIPRLNDDGVLYTDSHSILTYLSDEYDDADILYPTASRSRGVINQALFFDAGILTPSFQNYYFPVIELGQQFTTKGEEAVRVALMALNNMLEWQLWAGGSYISIADFSIAPTVSTADICGFDMSEFPNVVSWLRKISSAIPGYEEINIKGCYMFKMILDNALARYATTAEDTTAASETTTEL